MLSRHLLALATPIVALPLQALAAPETTPIETLDRITVTGTHIDKQGENHFLPITIISRKEIDRSGAASVRELLAKQVEVSGGANGNELFSTAPGAASVQLRGMSEKYVLVLLNGRRLANYGFATNGESTFVDLNRLPLGVIDRVEILRDGASAIYGSDAVAGVINIITRRNYQGIEGSLRLGQNQGSDGESVAANLTLGVGNLAEEGYNILLSLDALHQEPVLRFRHAATRTDDYRWLGGSDQRSDNGRPGSWANTSYVPDSEGYNTRDTNEKPMPGCAPGNVVQDGNSGKCILDAASFGWLSPRVDRGGMMLQATRRLDADAELFAELGFTRSSSLFNAGEPGINAWDASWWLDPSWKMYPANHGLEQINPTWQPGDSVQFVRSIYEAGVKTIRTTSDTLRLVSGLRTSWRDWDIETAITLDRNTITEEDGNQVIKKAVYHSLHDGVNGGPGYDPFALWNPSSRVAPLLTTVTRKGFSTLTGIDVKAQRDDLFTLPGGKASLATGVQIMHESMEDRPDPRVVNDEIFDQSSSSSRGARTTASAYAEVYLPLIPRLDARLALRADHFSDVRNSLTPKLALTWSPSNAMTLRGSFDTSFKAPTLPEMHATTQGYTYVSDTVRCQIMNKPPGSCPEGVKVYAKGNTDLKPETATNTSLGVLLTPIQGIEASLDWYRIDQRNTIQLMDGQYVLDHEGVPGNNPMIQRATLQPLESGWYPGLDRGKLTSLSLPYVNVGKTLTSGLDLMLSLRWPLGRYGALTLRENHNRLLTFKQSITDSEAPVSRLDSVYQPRWRNTLSLEWEQARLHAGITLRSFASTRNIDDPTHSMDDSVPARVPGFTMVDLQFGFNPTKQWQLSAGINNAGNKQPPFANGTGTGFFVGNWNDLWGRGYFIQANYTFR